MNGGAKLAGPQPLLMESFGKFVEKAHARTSSHSIERPNSPLSVVLFLFLSDHGTAPVEFGLGTVSGVGRYHDIDGRGRTVTAPDYAGCFAHCRCRLEEMHVRGCPLRVRTFPVAGITANEHGVILAGIVVHMVVVPLRCSLSRSARIRVSLKSRRLQCREQLIA